MSSNDDALIEKAATTIYACQHYAPEDFAHETARAVLDAIGDDLRAEVLEEAAMDLMIGFGRPNVAKWLRDRAANYRRERA